MNSVVFSQSGGSENALLAFTDDPSSCTGWSFICHEWLSKLLSGPFGNADSGAMTVTLTTNATIEAHVIP